MLAGWLLLVADTGWLGAAAATTTVGVSQAGRQADRRAGSQLGPNRPAGSTGERMFPGDY